jgi:ribosomal protein L37AE/L43A
MFCPHCKKEMVCEDEHIGIWYCKECKMDFHIAENPQY